MSDVREKIAQHIYESGASEEYFHALRTQNRPILDPERALADAIIAALPDMVKPLEWEHTMMTWGDRQPDRTYIEKPSAQYWEANGVKHRYEITEVLDERDPRSHGIFYLCIGGGTKQVGFPDLELAQDKANSHNCRIALSAFGIEGDG